jgi:hypothetical protein
MWMVPVILGTPRLTVVRRHTKQPLIEQIERAVVGAAEPPTGLDDLVENRLQPGRTRDRSKDTTDRALLLA